MKKNIISIAAVILMIGGFVFGLHQTGRLPINGNSQLAAVISSRQLPSPTITAPSYNHNASNGINLTVNGHYFKTLSNSLPFFYLGDTEWILNKFSNTDIKAILDKRKEDGFSVIKITNTELNVGYSYDRRDANGQTPFINNNILRFNPPWWDRISNIIDWAAERDLYIELTIGAPGRQEYPWRVINNPADAYIYGHLVGAYLANKTNVIFNVGQDMRADWGIGVTGWKAIAEGVADGKNGVSNFNDTADYTTTMLTFHTDGHSPYTSSFWFSSDSWEDYNAIEVWGNYSDIYGVVNSDFRLSPTKPTVVIEGSYEGGTDYIWAINPITPRYIRVEAWHSYFAGATGYTYGHVNNYLQWTSTGYVNSPGTVNMKTLRNFMVAREWWKFVPDQSIIMGDAGNGATRLAAVRNVEDGDEAYVYYPTKQSKTISLNCITTSNTVTAKWFDPRNGNTQTIGTYKKNINPTIIPAWPLTGNLEDAVLMLTASSGSVSNQSTSQ